MKFFKRGELGLLGVFYLDFLISRMLFILPVFMVVYFRDLGFSLFQISIITMMMPLFMLIFEIPTGAVADIYGRKFSVLLGIFIESIAIFSVFFLDNYYSILVAFAFIGFGSTFDSGAREAWVTDLIKNKKKDFLHNYFAKGDIMKNFGLIVSGILGAFLVKLFGVSIIWIVTGIAFLLSMFLLSFAEEHFVKRRVKVKDSLKEINKQTIKSIKYVRHHPILLSFLIAMSIFVFAGVFSGDLAWVTLLQELNFPDYAFGYLLSAIGFIGIIAPLFSIKFMKKNKERQFILISIIFGILTLSLIIFISNLFLILLIFLIFLFFTKMEIPAERIYFHRFIPSKLRATIGSVEMTFISIIGIIAMPLAGLSVDYFGAKYTIFISALIMIPSAIIYSMINDNP